LASSLPVGFHNTSFKPRNTPRVTFLGSTAVLLTAGAARAVATTKPHGTEMRVCLKRWRVIPDPHSRTVSCTPVSPALDRDIPSKSVRDDATITRMARDIRTLPRRTLTINSREARFITASASRIQFRGFFFSSVRSLCSLSYQAKHCPHKAGSPIWPRASGYHMPVTGIKMSPQRIAQQIIGIRNALANPTSSQNRQTFETRRGLGRHGSNSTS